MRVVAALSGGVDSAVAAARCVDAGHEVVGVHLALSRQSSSGRHRGCCTPDDARDARRVADVLGIPFFVWDFSERFADDVIEDFTSEYAAGRTPNPCVRCNERIKFAAVLDRARALGFDAVCTGHYAQLLDGAAGPELHRGIDETKDQSYVLAVLTGEQLAGAVFPVGDTRKDDIRAEARARGLLVADKPDSHDICFIPEGDAAAWLEERIGPAPADIVDAATGDVLGRTQTAYALTIGQRRGLNLTVPAEDGRPRYVVDVDVAAGRVSVASREALAVDRIEAERVRWCGGPVVRAISGAVQIRAHGEQVPAEVAVDGDVLVARLAAPAYGVAPGQTLVVYVGTRAVCSATIRAAERA
jgi:tRNA-specific 2-thiouridylase